MTSCEKDDDIIKSPRKIYIYSTTHTEIYLNYKNINYPTIQDQSFSNSPEVPYWETITLNGKIGDNIFLKQKTLQETYNNIDISLPQPSGWVLQDSSNYEILIIIDNDTLYHNIQTTPITISKTLI